jgi:hypothetical protein
MTASSKPSKKSKEYLSSRAWSEECITNIKKIQDEFLDRYYEDKEENTAILKLLQQLVERLEKNI